MAARGESIFSKKKGNRDANVLDHLHVWDMYLRNPENSCVTSVSLLSFSSH